MPPRLALATGGRRPARSLASLADAAGRLAGDRLALWLLPAYPPPHAWGRPGGGARLFVADSGADRRSPGWRPGRSGTRVITRRRRQRLTRPVIGVATVPGVARS